MNRADEEAITAKVRSLEGMPLDALRQEWRRLYGDPPPIRSVDLLSRWLAWKIQAEAFGGFDAETAKGCCQSNGNSSPVRRNFPNPTWPYPMTARHSARAAERRSL